MRMQANLPYYCWIGENKSLTAAEDMECKSSCCEVEEFPFREINSIVREMSCTACKILLGNLEKLNDFLRIDNWKLCFAGD